MMTRIKNTAAAVFFLLFHMQCGYAHGLSTQTTQNEQHNAILHYVNQYRAKYHLQPLKLLPMISAEASTHSVHMAKKSVPFGHQQFQLRMRRLSQRIPFCRGGAENVAYYRTNAKQLVDAWMASPGHRQNILGHYNVTGIGIAYDKRGWAYYTQIFLRTVA